MCQTDVSNMCQTDAIKYVSSTIVNIVWHFTLVISSINLLLETDYIGQATNPSVVRKNNKNLVILKKI